VRIRVLQRPASYVRVNLKHRGLHGQESEINKAIVLTLLRKCIILCQMYNSIIV